MKAEFVAADTGNRGAGQCVSVFCGLERFRLLMDQCESESPGDRPAVTVAAHPGMTRLLRLKDFLRLKSVGADGIKAHFTVQR